MCHFITEAQPEPSSEHAGTLFLTLMTPAGSAVIERQAGGTDRWKVRPRPLSTGPQQLVQLETLQRSHFLLVLFRQVLQLLIQWPRSRVMLAQ